MENERCPICQSVLRKKFWDTETTVGTIIKYNCALYGDDHYSQYLDEDNISIDEELLKIKIKDKEYHITQYHSDKYIIISIWSILTEERSSFLMPVLISNDKFVYEGQFAKQFAKLPFDFLNDDLNKIIQKIQVILTFQ
jgi:hypothetical protein